MPACEFSSVEAPSPAELRSLPGVARRTGPLVQQVLSTVVRSVDPPPPRCFV